MKPSNKNLSSQVKYRFVFMLAVLTMLINLSLICNRYFFLLKPEFCPWGLLKIEHVKVYFFIFCLLPLSFYKHVSPSIINDKELFFVAAPLIWYQLYCVNHVMCIAMLTTLSVTVLAWVCSGSPLGGRNTYKSFGLALTGHLLPSGCRVAGLAGCTGRTLCVPHTVCCMINAVRSWQLQAHAACVLQLPLIGCPQLVIACISI